MYEFSLDKFNLFFNYSLHSSEKRHMRSIIYFRIRVEKYYYIFILLEIR